MQDPLVSVIIATYNGKEKWFKQTIDSVLNQSYKNIELIIINDASTNNIESFILTYCKKYNTIIYLKNEKNCERSFSRNRGIFESKGKYLAFCDDDDLWDDNNKIKKQVNFLENNDDYVLCGTSIIEIDQDNNEIKKNVFNTGNRNLKNKLLYANQFALSSVMIKKEILLFSGLFDSSRRLGEDYDLRLRIGKYGKVENLDDSFIKYRVWQGNTSSMSKFRMKIEALKIMRTNKKWYPNFFRALLYRIIIDFILPQKIVNIIVKIIN